MYKTTQISPMLPTSDMQKTMEFFIETLKFSAVMDVPEYAIVRRDGFEVHFFPAGSEVNELTEMSFYMSVEDLDLVWDLLAPFKETLELREPFEQAYGMKETHVIVPATKALLLIGTPISYPQVSGTINSADSEE